MKIHTTVLLLVLVICLISGSDAWRRRRRRRRAPAPVNCQVSGWSGWSGCSVTCGQGTQTRSRYVTVNPANGGAGCPGLTETKTCSISKQNCVVSSWSSWGVCSQSCGSGSQTRTRHVTVNPAHCGSACPSLKDTRGCTGTQCPVNCQVSSWSAWGSCSVSCGDGTHSRTRQITANPAYGGDSCPATVEHEKCVVPKQDCVVSSWSSWGVCSQSCGSGSQTRTRHVTVNPAHCGSACPSLQDSRGCTGTQCPVNCQVSSWSAWGSCSVSCGDGTHSRTRQITANPAYGGDSCPATVEHGTCVVPKQDCVVSPWGSWGVCSKACGPGNQERSRVITVDTDHCGAACPPLQDSQGCTGIQCPVDCQVGSWSSWGSCSVSCGNGTHSRTRNITVNPAYGGDSCPATVEHGTCVVPKQDCVVSSWGSWGVCSKACGPGSQNRSRIITVDTDHCGAACPPLQDSQGCTGIQCPVDCQVSSWSDWTDCSVSCGEGTITRTREVKVYPEYGGKVCPHLHEKDECSISQQDCEVSPWTLWSECSGSCSNATITRSREITTQSSGCGKACPSLSQTNSCIPSSCVKDCVVGEWSDWTDCSESCGTGVELRYREITQVSEYGGDECPKLTEEKSCSVPQIDCEVSKWSTWGQCSTTCGPGIHQKTRTIVHESEGCGKSCPMLEETKPCKNLFCEAECEDETKIPNAEVVGEGLDVATLVKTVPLLDNSKNNGYCDTVYYKDDDVTYQMPYNLETFLPVEHEITSFEVKSQKSLAALLEDMQENIQNKHEYAGTSEQLPLIHEAVPYATAGNNSLIEKLILGSHDNEYKYFSIRAVAIIAEFKLKDNDLILNPEFKSSLDNLPVEYNEKMYMDILNQYGTHYYTKGIIGGKYEYIYEYSEAALDDSGLTDKEQRKCLENEARIEFLGEDASIRNIKCSNLGKSRTLFTNAATSAVSFVSGGNPVIAETLNINSGAKKFVKWMNSIPSNPAILNYKISPISELVGPRVSHANVTRQNLEMALLHYMQEYNPTSCAEQVCHNGAMKKVVNTGKSCLCVCLDGWYGSQCDRSDA
uniref:thrombospondin type-1 domain-containing protein 7B-like isoform X3 n=1 Tax=Ciona intestinalis TaxID=7719 RepID=UPI000EF518FE|nr:thrombospondin type-1 domain-containing protein 7B-like isoform X3 [Ciona intestinalis]|eukprot:XP_026689790.1 thrombospondin type-1 domain-containing protein 7B-like isoform X3 [Ciona intestinalis]